MSMLDDVAKESKTVGTTVPSQPPTGLVARKGPSKRKRRVPAQPAVSGIVLWRSSSSRLLSSSLHAKPVDPANDLVGQIMSTMRSNLGSGFMHSTMRSSATLHDSEVHHASTMATTARELDERTRGARGTDVWRCRGCGTEDKSVLELNAERSFVHCSACGAADGIASAVDNPFEQTAGYQRVECEDGQGVADRVLSTQNTRELRGLRDSSMRHSCIGTASSSSSMARAHASVNRGLSKSPGDGDAMLSKQQITKRDAIVVKIHGLITKSGRNPDTCPIFRHASNVASSTFAKACYHSSVCKRRTPTCPGILCARLPKYIAKEAVYMTLQRAERDTTLSGACVALSTEDVQNATNSILPLLSSYTQNVSLRTVIGAEFTSALDAPPGALTKGCTETADTRPAQAASSSCSSSTPTGECAEGGGDRESDAWKMRLAHSLDALRDMNMINKDGHEAASRIATSFAYHEWLKGCLHLPPDIASLLICTRTAATDYTTNLNTTLQELSKRHGVDDATIEALTTSLCYTNTTVASAQTVA